MKVLKSPRVKDRASSSDLYGVSHEVRRIIDWVVLHGDRAVLEGSRLHDRSSRDSILVPVEELQRAHRSMDPELLEAVRYAASNVETFAQRQKGALMPLEDSEVRDGVYLGHRVVPVDSCGIYIPGGSYPLISTAVMLAVPARVAGVGRICACTPVRRGTDSPDPSVLGTLYELGVTEVYAAGGAYAVAAMAHGTESIPPVDVIVGPGNKYVTEAKRQCFGKVGIDFVAGPSEVLIIAQEGDPDFIAWDLLAQAEHDPDAKGVLVTTSPALARQVMDRVETILGEIVTSPVARSSWEDHGEVLAAEGMDEAVEFSNRMAPEHLELMVQDPDRWIPRLRNYGALFIGEHSAEVFGDYASGSNHTLPTAGASRYTGGLWVGTFLKVLTSQRVTREGARELARVSALLAQAEGLMAHRGAALARSRKG